MNEFWLALVNTPWWVYILFGFILYKGIRSFKERTVPLKKLIILPLLLVVISFHTILSQVSLNAENIFMLSISLLVGLVLGAWLVIKSNIVVDRKHLLFRVPGGYLTFFLILSVFAIKYYMGYEEAIDPKLLQQGGFETFAIIATALLGGLFGGRIIGYAYHYHNSDSIL